MARQAVKRRQDWPARLDAALMAARGRTFAWGAWDCALFAADVVDAMCASRLARRWRGKYRTARGARGVLRRAGGIEAVMAKIGRAVPVRLAQRGDIVLLPAAGAERESAGVMLAVCLGERLVGAGPSGLVLVPLDHGIRAWHIPVEGEA